MDKHFSHGGIMGDLMASLPVIRHLGGGKLLIPLGRSVGPTRMDEARVAFLRPLLEQTDYITECRSRNPSDKIDYDLDGFLMHLKREVTLTEKHFLGVGIDIMADPVARARAHRDPFLRVKQRRIIPNRRVAVCRTARYREGSPDHHPFWKKMMDDGLGESGVFFGLPQEHEQFERLFGKIDYRMPSCALELAECVAAMECVVSNPTFLHWIGVGLGKTTILEARRTMPWEKNECHLRRPNHFMMPWEPHQ